MASKVPSGQIGSAWEWYHWIGLEKDINRYRFLIFLFQCWIFETTSKFWAASCKKASNPPRSFSPNHAPKMRERYQLFFGLRLEGKKFHHSAIQTKIEKLFGGFFLQIKVCQPIGRQDSMQTVIWTSRRLDSFLHEARTYSSWCPFKGLSNDTTLMQIQSGRTVPLRSLMKRWKEHVRIRNTEIS